MPNIFEDHVIPMSKPCLWAVEDYARMILFNAYVLVVNPDRPFSFLVFVPLSCKVCEAPLFRLARPHGNDSVEDCSLFLLALSGSVSDQGGESV